MSKPPINFSKHILTAKQQPLSYLLCKAEYLKQLNKLISSYLEPSPLAQHCQVGSWDDNQLILIVENAAWATQLRYILPNLLSFLQSQPGFAKLQQLLCKIYPALPITLPSTPIAVSLDEENAELMRTIANSIKDIDLQSALLRLAAHASK